MGYRYGWSRVGCAAALVLLAFAPARGQEVRLGGSGASMRYLANRTDPGLGLGWTAESFDDQGWNVGEYGVGYELTGGAERLIRTAVPTDTASVFTRFTFALTDAASIGRVDFGADYDDGIVVWLNGVEVFRSPEMPAGVPTWNSTASIHESSNGYLATYTPYQDLGSVALPLLQDGQNVLAVGVWNGTLPSSDLLVVPQLVLDRATTLVRGPYLQQGSDTSLTLRWRTSDLQSTRVAYGSAPSALSGTAMGALAPSTEHEVRLSGLEPGTRYFYAVGDAADLLVGADDRHYFQTSPAVGTPTTARIWVLGDSGTADANARSVRDGYYAFAGSTHADLWLMLGDNAYPSGTDAEHQVALFDMFPDTLRTTVLWPTIGNHEASSTDSPTETGPYFDLFTLPANAQVGGVASSTEAYYSFDFANVHFVVLDSADSDRSTGGDMLTWLAQDLGSTLQDWIVAYWHHPPYSKGSHDSDNPLNDNLELVEMRVNAVPLLEAHGVDLVLTGHSHSYERSFLIDGHHGTSQTFGPQFVIDGGDGRETGDGVYLKSAGNNPSEGAVYVVAGHGAQAAGGSLDHPAMYVALDVLGSLVLDLDGGRIDASMVDSSGGVLDRFSLVKGAYCVPGTDPDGDRVCDPEDNCPTDPNPEQLDGDGDGSGDLCDACPLDPLDDADGDQVCADEDNCPLVFNPCQLDGDGDGIGTICDAPSPSACNVFVSRDSWIDQSDPGDNFGQDEDLESENKPGGQARPVIRFDLSTIPAGAAVLRATAWLRVLDRDGSGLPVNLHRITEAWSESGVNWNNTAADFDPAVAASITPTVSNAWVSADLTALTDAWLDGGLPNHGVMLRSTSSSRKSKYASSEFEILAFRPCMEVVTLCLTPGLDGDGDGTPDSQDGCPNDPAKVAPGPCGCGEIEIDSDGDGTFDCNDACPLDPAKVAPGPCGCGAADGDTDADGQADCVDPCINDSANDVDLDGRCADVDNCSAIANAVQGDADADGTGDACDACPLDPMDDQDADGTCAEVDNCPQLANPSQADSDGDGAGDPCDACPADPEDDVDGDGVCGNQDNCPGTPNPDQQDSAGGPAGDACELAGDGDFDGTADPTDNCVTVSNPAQRDTDGDGLGDACDDDDDGDEVPDGADCAPLSPAVTARPATIGSTLRLSRQAGTARLTWSPALQGHLSNVYRGERSPGQSVVSPLACAGFATPLRESLQLDVPASGGVYTYLVAPFNRCGEGGVGQGSAGSVRSLSPTCPYGPRDSDADGVDDGEDNCPLAADPTLLDTDGDFLGDACDPCPTLPDCPLP